MWRLLVCAPPSTPAPLWTPDPTPTPCSPVPLQTPHRLPTTAGLRPGCVLRPWRLEQGPVSPRGGLLGNAPRPLFPAPRGAGQPWGALKTRAGASVAAKVNRIQLRCSYP